MDRGPAGADLADMINHVRDRIHERMDAVTRSAMMGDSEWKQALLETLGPNALPSQATDVIRQVAIHRDRWGIDDSPLPLGPVPDSYDWEQQEQRARITRLVDQSALSSPSYRQASTLLDDPTTWEDRLINVGWQI